MTTTTPIRVLFVDDHPVVAAGLALRYGQREGFAVLGTAATVHDALEVLDAAGAARADGAGVDVVVADVQLAVPLTPRQVQALAARAHVVLFSARSTDPIVEQLRAAGAAAVVDKGAPLDELDAVLRAVATGAPLSTLMSSTSTASSLGAAALLSPREREVYRALARCQTPKEAAAALGIASSTVYCHIDRIRQKLGVSTLQEIVALALSDAR